MTGITDSQNDTDSRNHMTPTKNYLLDSSAQPISRLEAQAGANYGTHFTRRADDQTLMQSIGDSEHLINTGSLLSSSRPSLFTTPQECAETPIDVISKKLFIERLKASPLWEETERKQEDRYSFRLGSINGFLQIQGDGSFSKSEKITKIIYSPLNVKQRNKYGHQLLDQEKFAMTEIIDLVIDDHEKSAEILDQLYQQYLVKAENNDVLNDEETQHSYIRYDGKLFEFGV